METNKNEVPVIPGILPTYYRHRRLKALQILVSAMTTNQKVVGSNPAGLTSPKR